MTRFNANTRYLNAKGELVQTQVDVGRHATEKEAFARAQSLVNHLGMKVKSVSPHKDQ